MLSLLGAMALCHLRLVASACLRKYDSDHSLELKIS